jgi:excisionase family DNA binding protein
VRSAVANAAIGREGATANDWATPYWSVVPATSPKYGLASDASHPYAPPISEPHSTFGHPTGADATKRAQRGNDHMGSMAVNELGPMLTATEVADMLHLHVNTVKRLGDRGELPFYRVCKRGDRRFRLDDVMKFLAQNR